MARSPEREAQCAAVLALLQKGLAITAKEALNLFGCFRLAARIHDLRLQGHKIESIPEGDGVKHWVRYRLAA